MPDSPTLDSDSPCVCDTMVWLSSLGSCRQLQHRNIFQLVSRSSFVYSIDLGGPSFPDACLITSAAWLEPEWLSDALLANYNTAQPGTCSPAADLVTVYILRMSAGSDIL